MACDGSTILVEKTNFQALNNVAKVSLKLQPILIQQMNFDCGKQHEDLWPLWFDWSQNWFDYKNLRFDDPVDEKNKNLTIHRETIMNMEIQMRIQIEFGPIVFK